jgi:hypothetical protein
MQQHTCEEQLHYQLHPQSSLSDQAPYNKTIPVNSSSPGSVANSFVSLESAMSNDMLSLSPASSAIQPNQFIQSTIRLNANSAYPTRPPALFLHAAGAANPEQVRQAPQLGIDEFMPSQDVLTSMMSVLPAPGDASGIRLPSLDQAHIGGHESDSTSNVSDPPQDLLLSQFIAEDPNSSFMMPAYVAWLN